MVLKMFIAKWKALWRGEPPPPLEEVRPYRQQSSTEAMPLTPTPPRVPPRLATALALAVLLLLGMFHAPATWTRNAYGGCLLVPAFLWCCVHLSFFGLRELGEGWRRWVRLAALALPLALLMPFTQGAMEGLFHDLASGWRDGYVDGGGRASDLPPAPPAPRPQTPWERTVPWGFAAVAVFAFHRLARHREEAERQRARAEALRDQALRAKLAPHFIFNTLNTLHAQIEADPRAAQATTEHLAHLFRQVVQVADHPTIPLRQELSFVEAYLAIEKARLGNRLITTIDVPEELEDTPVPPLALQVLVENAVKHGVAPQEGGGTVAIRVVRLRSTLQVCVMDSGTGLGSEPGTGTALDTLRQRLAKPEDLTLLRTSEGFRACFVWRQG